MALCALEISRLSSSIFGFGITEKPANGGLSDLHVPYSLIEFCAIHSVFHKRQMSLDGIENGKDQTGLGISDLLIYFLASFICDFCFVDRLDLNLTPITDNRGRMDHPVIHGPREGNLIGGENRNTM